MFVFVILTLLYSDNTRVTSNLMLRRPFHSIDTLLRVTHVFNVNINVMIDYVEITMF